MAIKQTVPIKFTSRDFSSIRNDLVEYAKRYYPDSYRDFNEAGFAAAMIDLTAYLGDQLSFYVDYNSNESMPGNSLEYNNIIRHGRAKGYKFRPSQSTYGYATFFILVPANSVGLGPNLAYAPKLLNGSEFGTKGGNNFILIEDVDFSNTNHEVVVARVNSDTGLPTYYAVKAQGKVVSGRLLEEIVTVGSYKRFLRVPLNSSNIAEIISVVDDEGHEYYEVEHLSQNIIFKEIPNTNSDRDSAISILKPFLVPRRFTFEQEKESAYLQFGYGSEPSLTNDQVLDPANVLLNIVGKNYISNDSFDPTKLMQTDKFGVVPTSTNLRIIMRVNSSEDVNAPSESLTEVLAPKIRFESELATSAALKKEVAISLEVINEEAIIGSVSAPSSAELRHRIDGNYSAQSRAVTRQDYISLVYNMPAKFGAIKRANITQDSDSFRRNLNLYVISESDQGTLTTTNNTIKNNLKVWLNHNKMIHDTIDILNAQIVNIGINFQIIVERGLNKYDVLSAAVSELKTKLSNFGDIGEPFYITNVAKILNKVRGVVDVTSVEVEQKIGSGYSSVRFDLDLAKSPDGRVIEVPENIIIEIKYPNIDIKGSLSR